jgi:ribosomal-protein-alanine N-acetyltransferase
MINTEEDILTANLVLEPILPSHAEKLFSLLQAPELYYFIPQDPPKNIQKLVEKYQKWSKRKSDDNQETWLNYAVYHPLLCQYAGTLQATIQRDNTYIAYEVFPSFWRKGIATEACSAFIQILFKNYPINLITAHTDTRNIASQRLLEALGFEKTDTILNADGFKGSTSNEHVYKLTK